MPSLTRTVVLAQLLFAVVAAVAGVVSLVMFTQVDWEHDDGLSGFLLVYAAAGLLFALVTGLLGWRALRARDDLSRAVALLWLSLWVLVCAALPATVGLGAEWWWTVGSVVIIAVPLAGVVLGSRGLSRPR